MKKYTFTCTCGDKMTVTAVDVNDAKTKFTEMMTEAAVTAHFADKHAGQEMPAYDILIQGALENLVEEEDTVVISKA